MTVKWDHLRGGECRQVKVSSWVLCHGTFRVFLQKAIRKQNCCYCDADVHGNINIILTPSLPYTSAGRSGLCHPRALQLRWPHKTQPYNAPRIWIFLCRSSIHHLSHLHDYEATVSPYNHGVMIMWLSTLVSPFRGYLKWLINTLNCTATCTHYMKIDTCIYNMYWSPRTIHITVWHAGPASHTAYLPQRWVCPGPIPVVPGSPGM